jgi:hypothetical protein
MTSRACVFIHSDHPNARNRLINTITCIKPKFPPSIDLRELIAKQTFTDSSRSSGRAPNAFIIYRKAFVEAARKDGYQLPMTVVSSMASSSWDLEPQFVKEEYKKLAKEANAIRNKLIPRLNKRRRQKWNIVSFPPPTKTSPSPPSPPSPVTNKTKSINKKKKVENKEIPSSSTVVPSHENPITFHIPYDICSTIVDRYTFIDNSTFDSTTNSAQKQPQQNFDFNDLNFNNFNDYIPQTNIQSYNHYLEEQIVSTFNVAVDITTDINSVNSEFEYDSASFSTFFDDYGAYYPSFLDEF